jgi:hypothetical protein
MPIANSSDLIRVLNPLLSKVVSNVEGQVRTLLREYIVKYTYQWDTEVQFQINPGEDDAVESGTINRYYFDKTGVPTYQFLNAWVWEKLSSRLNIVSSRLFNDPTLMAYDPSKYLHGSEETGDVRSEMADILNIAGGNKGDFPNKKQRMPYWDLLIEELFANDRLDDMFYIAMSEEMGQFMY